MRPLLLVLFVFLLTLATPYSVSQQNVADVVKQSSDAVVLIVISNASGEETALGSGFLISADGEIVTNHHVIKDAHSAIVKLSNGAFFPVSGVLADDSARDLAVIKVNGKNLPFLSLGEMDNIRVGDHVVAIGSPLGLEGTVSDGVVSAVRDVDNKKWIQTTAPASHGNSGGPLLDMNDHVVGVITAGVNPELGQNLNFAVPCSEVASLLVTAHQHAAPLASVADKTESTLSNGTVWTSLTTGRDYSIRQDGDYLYMDWISIPAEIKNAGGFSRSEMRKGADGKWHGKARMRLPCRYTRGLGAYARTVTNWCSREDDAEIDFLSDKRIEGISIGWQKFDCRKCEAKEEERKSFALIPK
ncbi:MAG: trypsin-like peptidase domain-containing protein [Candidatus Sulfotelmatobacter sp.]